MEDKAMSFFKFVCSRVIPIAFGLGLLTFASHQMVATLTGEMGMVFMPGATNTILVVAACIAGFVLMRLALHDVHLLSCLTLLFTVSAGALFFLGAFELLGLVYPRPFVGPFTYVGLSEVLGGFPAQIFGWSAHASAVIFIMIICFGCYLWGKSALRDMSFD
ncbi:MAG: hypothetical protein ACJKSS_00505 [Patescibacteria group bacterium UBA2103]